MRIIERTSPFDKSITYVVQEAGWNGANAFQNAIEPNKVFGKIYQDIREFPSLIEARVFAFQYESNLQLGERIVG